MLLAIDIGNTQTAIGLFKGDKIISSWRMITRENETGDELASIIFSFLRNSDFNPLDVKNIAISCVVPVILDEITKMSLKYFKKAPFIVDSNVKSGLVISYDYPYEIGADRIANSVAAKEIYGYPAIVVDFGTATTFDILSSEGEYVGGVIAPGIEISAEALFNRAAKLSKVDLSWPDFVIGKNTSDCIRSGVLYGFLGQVDFIVGEIVNEINGQQNNRQQKNKRNNNDFKPVVIGTGGLAFLMIDRSKWIKIYDPELTLKGLKILFDKNI
jgi:type III pantothenate kinase